MEHKLKVGIKNESKLIVKEEHTAANYGSGSIYVFATPAMIGLIENAALKAAEEYLPKGFTTVGIHLDVKHLAATPMGMETRAVAELIEIDGKKLKFKVEAYDETQKIGEGFHSRYIINSDQFMNKVNNL